MSPAKEAKAARLAHVLAQAVRNDELEALEALRVIRHELRLCNTNKKLSIPTRSVAAQAAIDKYSAAGVPKNASSDALHADHVHPLTELALHSMVASQVPGKRNGRSFRGW